MSPTVEEQGAAVALISHYARSVDAADVSAVLQCFTDDVSLSYDSGRLRVSGRIDAEAFFRDALRGPSTHLISNYAFERTEPAILVTCSAIACVCRKDGLVTLRGLVYLFACVWQESVMRIQRLEHSLQWECDAPGGPR